MLSEYTIRLSQAQAKVVWGALLKLPGEVSFDALLALKVQFDAQEQGETTLPAIEGEV